jgi:hypothetical protein
LIHLADLSAALQKLQEIARFDQAQLRVPPARSASAPTSFGVSPRISSFG